MQWNNINSNTRAILIFSGIVFCLFVYGKLKFRNLDKNARYTYGRFSGTSPRKNGTSFSYYYIYEGKTYQGNYLGLGNDFYVEDLILIQFQSTDPQIHKPLHNYKFLKNVNSKEFPLNGWDTLPVKLIMKRE